MYYLLFDRNDCVKNISVFSRYCGRGGYLARLSHISAVVALHIDIELLTFAGTCIKGLLDI